MTRDEILITYAATATGVIILLIIIVIYVIVSVTSFNKRLINMEHEALNRERRTGDHIKAIEKIVVNEMKQLIHIIQDRVALKD